MSGSGDVEAAGGVVWRMTEAGLRIALVHRPRYDDWSLPKGKRHPQEPLVATAVREVVEETGLRVVVGRSLGRLRYPLPGRTEGQHKLVSYWAMHAPEGDFQPNDEVDELRWCDPESALATLSWPHDRDPVRRLLGGPVTATTVLLVRHGRAGDKRRWRSRDDERPLDAVGREQARALAGVAPLFAPREVVAADLVRCEATVRPAAKQLGLCVTAAPDLSDRTHESDPDAAMRFVRACAQRSVATLACGQGGVIPDTITRLAREDGLPLPEVRARKGSVWVLSFSSGRLIAADYLESLLT